MSRRPLYAALVLIASLSFHRPALAQISDPGPSGGGTCQPVVPEAGSLTGTEGARIGWPGLRGFLVTGFRWSSRLSLPGRSLPYFVRRRAGS